MSNDPLVDGSVVAHANADATVAAVAAGEIQLAQPIPVGNTDPKAPGRIVLVANDKKTRFSVDAETLKRYSPFVHAVLADETDTEEDLPLDSERANATTLAFFATWLKRHETVRPSKIAVPLPRLLRIEDYYTDPWDLEFIRQHFVGSVDDMSRCRPLYALALFSVYLQVRPLTQMIATFFAFQLKKGVREAGDPTRLISGWFGRTLPYTQAEVGEAAEWVRETLRGLQLPERRTIDSDDDYDEHTKFADGDFRHQPADRT